MLVGGEAGDDGLPWWHCSSGGDDSLPWPRQAIASDIAAFSSLVRLPSRSKARKGSTNRVWSTATAVRVPPLHHASLHGHHFLGFVAALSASVHGRKLSDPLPSLPSPAVNALLDLIFVLSALVESTPPLPHNSRYGNPAFRLWHEKLTDSANELIARIAAAAAASPLDLAGAEVELAPYLLDSFGNATRIENERKKKGTERMRCLTCGAH